MPPAIFRQSQRWRLHPQNLQLGWNDKVKFQCHPVPLDPLGHRPNFWMGRTGWRVRPPSLPRLQGSRLHRSRRSRPRVRRRGVRRWRWGVLHRLPSHRLNRKTWTSPTASRDFAPAMPLRHQIGQPQQLPVWRRSCFRCLRWCRTIPRCSMSWVFWLLKIGLDGPEVCLFV